MFHYRLHRCHTSGLNAKFFMTIYYNPHCGATDIRVDLAPHTAG
jgi:hypothetical protein